MHAGDETIPPSSPTDVLKEFCEKIVNVFQADHSRFANAFLEVDLVFIETVEKIRELNETKRQKAERLHTELLRTVKSRENYDKFISVLKKEPVCAELLKIIPSSLSGKSEIPLLCLHAWVTAHVHTESVLPILNFCSFCSPANYVIGHIGKQNVIIHVCQYNCIIV